MTRTRRVGFDLEKRSRMALAYPAGFPLMEVKANECVPPLTTILAHHECNLDRIIKYCHGITGIKEQEDTVWQTIGA